jgi:hypothetical protein
MVTPGGEANLSLLRAQRQVRMVYGDSRPSAARIVLTDDERAELEGWARRRTSAAGLALRAKVVLAAAEGVSTPSWPPVWVWIGARFASGATGLASCGVTVCLMSHVRAGPVGYVRRLVGSARLSRRCSSQARPAVDVAPVLVPATVPAGTALLVALWQVCRTSDSPLDPTMGPGMMGRYASTRSQVEVVRPKCGQACSPGAPMRPIRRLWPTATSRNTSM